MKIDLRYSTLTNYRQCPFRLVLLDKMGKQPLFVPQYVGLYTHFYIESFLRNEVNGENLPLDDETIHRMAIENRLVTDEDEMRKAVKRLPLSMWREKVLSFVRSLGVMRLETEVLVQRGNIYGTMDILAETEDEYIIIDLKRSELVEHYSSDQMNLYAYLVRGKLKDKPLNRVFLVFLLWSGVAIREYRLDTRKERLKAMLDELERIRVICENDLYEYLPPNPAHRTCHPNRCAVWSFCPFGGAIKETDYETVREEHYGSGQHDADAWSRSDTPALDEDIF